MRKYKTQEEMRRAILAREREDRERDERKAKRDNLKKLKRLAKNKNPDSADKIDRMNREEDVKKELSNSYRKRIDSNIRNIRNDVDDGDNDIDNVILNESEDNSFDEGEEIDDILNNFSMEEYLNEDEDRNNVIAKEKKEKKRKQKSKKKKRKKIIMLISSVGLGWVLLILFLLLLVLLFAGTIIVMLAFPEIKNDLKEADMLGDEEIVYLSDEDIGDVEGLLGEYIEGEGVAMFGDVSGNSSGVAKGNTDTANTGTTDMGDAMALLEDMWNFEMGGAKAGTVAGDLGDGAGFNYGAFSFTQNYTMNSLLDYMGKVSDGLRSKLTAPMGSAEFNNQWKQLGGHTPPYDGSAPVTGTNEQEMLDIQAGWMVNNFLPGQLELLKNATGIDLNDGTHTLGAMSVFICMVHQRPAWMNELIIPAVQSMGGSFSDDKFIDATSGYLATSYGGNYASSIRSRYAQQTAIAKQKNQKFKVKIGG